ncbi:DNA-binding response regulator [Streptomyces sp. me109]|uniref:response regulator transcription factor n=1 Tax=Streptomyces sp. me109 TaxID=1827853 RepID=UPI0011CED1F8|nr:response regulator transcription factor [Streptomyces sp. me109]TXS79006.1 DNA-binding response regulator [Streptomyces sp. me109]
MAEARAFTEQDPIRVFLLDDHEVVRRGPTDLLDAEPDISVVGDAGSVEHALVRGPALRPHVAVLDVRLPDPAVAPELAGLSPRERDVLALIGDGLTNREFGKKLYLSEKTVKNHISRLLAKLGVQRRVQAAVLATHLGSPDQRGRSAR